MSSSVKATKASSGGQTTCYVIAYDIPNDKRRTKVHQLLLGYGKWTQYSLFECFLTRKQYILLRAKLEEYLNSTQDNVRFYPLNADSLSKVETVGGKPPAMRLDEDTTAAELPEVSGGFITSSIATYLLL